MGGLPNELILDPHVAQTEGLQIGDHKLSIACGVVERPDHHCGDDHAMLNLDIGDKYFSDWIDFSV